MSIKHILYKFKPSPADAQKNINANSTYIFIGVIPLCNFQKFLEILFALTVKTVEDVYKFWYKYKPSSDGVQRRKTISPPTFLMELCPFVILSWQLYPLLYGDLVPSVKGIFMKLLEILSII